MHNSVQVGDSDAIVPKKLGNSSGGKGISAYRSKSNSHILSEILVRPKELATTEAKSRRRKLTTLTRTHSEIKPIKKEILRNNERYNMQDELDELYSQSKEGRTFKKLFELIVDDRNLELAYRNVKSNTGSSTPGVNGHTIKYWESKPLEDYLSYMKKRLANYFPHKVKRVEIPKPNGKTRPLGIPTIEDRLIQQAIKQILEPICEAKFYEHSYGFRPNRGTVHAIAELNRIIDTMKMYYIVSVDIKGFFDNVNHAKLKQQMWTMGIQDKRVLSIISKMLEAEIDGVGKPSKGTPQGGILSPLLANIVLNELDHWIANQWRDFEIKEIEPRITATGRLDRGSIYRKLRKKTNLKEMYIVRYADDFKIICRTYDEAQRAYHATQKWLLERLKLETSEEKSRIDDIRKQSVEFLGFRLIAKQKGNKWTTRSHISEKAKKAIEDNVREGIAKIRLNPTPQEVMRYNSLILGVQAYYRSATNVAKDLQDIENKVRIHRHNQLKNIGSYKGKTSSLYQKKYGDRHIKTMFINGTALYPLAAQNYVVPKSFTQAKCNYTKSGREMIHRDLKFGSEVLTHLMEDIPQNMTTQMADNRISRYLAQYGKCYVSGDILRIGEMEAHHIIPKSMGGTDEYKNLAWVTTEIHKLIHATEADTIRKYLSKTKLDREKMEKLNSLRDKAGHQMIEIEM